MTLRVWSAPYGYRGADRFDITRGKAQGDGLVFAPSQTILSPALAARKRAVDVQSRAPDVALAVETAAWKVYVPAYTAEMRVSYVKHRDAWDRLLARDEVTLCCFCNLTKFPLHCHRVLLGNLLAKCGAEYHGER